MAIQPVFLNPFGRHVDSSLQYIAEQTVNAHIKLVYTNEQADLAELKKIMPRDEFEAFSSRLNNGCVMQAGDCIKTSESPCKGFCSKKESGFIKWCDCSTAIPR